MTEYEDVSTLHPQQEQACFQYSAKVLKKWCFEDTSSTFGWILPFVTFFPRDEVFQSCTITAYETDETLDNDLAVSKDETTVAHAFARLLASRKGTYNVLMNAATLRDSSAASRLPFPCQPCFRDNTSMTPSQLRPRTSSRYYRTLSGTPPFEFIEAAIRTSPLFQTGQ